MSVFNGPPPNTIEDTKTFFLTFFLSMYITKIFIISRLFDNKIVFVLSVKVLVYSRAIYYLRYKKVFPDEKPKTRFLYTQKIQKVTKIINWPQKKYFLVI